MNAALRGALGTVKTRQGLGVDEALECARRGHYDLSGRSARAPVYSLLPYSRPDLGHDF